MGTKIVYNETKNTLTSKGFADAGFSGVSSQVKKFDTTYSSDKVRDLFAEYDSVSVADSDFKNMSVVKNDAIAKSDISFRTKIFVSSAVLIFSLLLFLAIYNIFVINSINSDISILQQEVISEQQVLQETVKRHSKLPSNEEFKEKLRNEGFSELLNSSVIQLSLDDVQVVEDLKGDTNWFDAFCNFLNKVFNGG